MFTDIKTYEDGSAIVQPDPSTLDALMAIPNQSDRDTIVKDYQLKIVIAGINMMPANASEKKLEKPWVPDLTDGTWKHYLWLKVYKDESKPSGFGLSFGDFVNSYSRTYCGSRFLFRSLDRAKYAFSQFPDLFEASYLINK